MLLLSGKLDRGVMVKVYDDNATILSYMGLDARYEVLRVAMTTNLTNHCWHSVTRCCSL